MDFKVFSDESDDFLLSNEAVNLLGEIFLWDENIEKVAINTRGGEDAVRIGNTDSQFVRILTGDGEDRITVLNTAGIDGLKIEAGAGNDYIEMRGGQFTSFVQAFGGVGNDNLFVTNTSFARGVADGGDGNDTVTVDYARRTGRRIDARDTGSGNARLVVRGSDFIDRIDMLSTSVIRSGEPVIFDAGTETLLNSCD